MKDLIPFIVFALVIITLVLISARARRRQADIAAGRAESIGVGTDVMTTSGLHGTVVARNDDDTVQLSIAPGVEVRWELAALRDLRALPAQFRRDADADADADRPRTDTVDLDKLDSGDAP
ncbi:MAG TPA: preprotein translocase subunit YajC [Jatrophihabitans sp.]|jgi:preprotein translocase subunit YajC|uniref:preprotein translocase subunit YajC n=1 Tax=Jatrophihabitans sp. TaxID=1932789 RepID=UPI002E09F069|nr:preprotein translocase subunit YajC [Jatrophihabitans sp.]